MTNKKNVLLLLVLGIMQWACAQYTTLGQGAFNGSTAGPWRVSTTDISYHSRFAYIYPSAVISNIKHGDTLTSIEVSRVEGAAPNFNTVLSIYAVTTTATDFGSGGIKWDSLSAKCKLIFSGSPAGYVGNKTKSYALPVNNGPYVYDTTTGTNLVLLFDYSQTSIQPGLIGFDYDAGNINAYTANTCKYVYGVVKNNVLSNSTNFHPKIILNYPRKEYEMALLKLYSLGKMPVPLGNPDSVRLLLRNTGKKPLNNWVYLRITGANARLDSTLVTMAVGDETFVSLKTISVNSQGLDSLLAYTPLGMAGFDSAYTFRKNTENLYSYENPLAPGNAGGIGFNGGTGDFVARFFSNTQKYINQISVNFGQGGRPFRIGIWAQKNGGLPGNLIWQSDSLISQAGKYILDITNPVLVNGNFFVGVRQLGVNNVAFGYQPEEPVRPNTFLYAFPLNDTNWTDFAPNAPFRFLIEPRIQADTDLIVSSIISPLDTFLVNSADSIQPSCKVKNIGVFGVKDKPFSLQCLIKQFNTVLYNETIYDTLSKGLTRTYVFNKKIKPSSFGPHQAVYIVRYQGDKVMDNDTLIKNFIIGIKNEVGIADVYDPIENNLYRYKLDTFLPLINIKNIGFNATPVFNVNFSVWRNGTQLYSENAPVSLDGGTSKIVFFKNYKCPDTGRLQVIYKLNLTNDSYLENNQDIVNILVYKIRDLKADSVIQLGNNQAYALNTAVAPVVRVKNEGLLDEINAKLYAVITSAYTPQIYRDTLNYNCDYKETKNLSMKPYIGIKKGIYNVTYISKHPVDLYEENDTLKSTFTFGNGVDYMLKSIDFPANNQSFTLNPDSFLRPQVTIKNNGFLKLSNPCAVHYVITKNNSTVYHDIKSLTLDTGQQFTIPFSTSFKLSNPGKYEVTCFTSFAGDEVNNNDTQRLGFLIEIDRDVELDSLTSADSAYLWDAPLNISAVARNNGNLDMSNQVIVLSIDNIIRDSVVVDLPAFGSKIINFDYGYKPAVIGSAQVVVYAAYRPDVVAINDTIKKTIRSFIKHNLGIVFANSFCATSLMVKNQSISIPIEVLNTGVKTAPTTQAVVSVVDSKDGIPVFLDTVTIGNIAAAQKTTFNTSKLWTVSTSGAFVFKSYLFAIDSLLDNDTALCFITVAQNGVAKINTLDAVQVIPNPVVDLVKLQGVPNDAKIKLYNAFGKFIADIENREFSMKELSAGSYLLRVSNSTNTKVYKLLKQ